MNLYQWFSSIFTVVYVCTDQLVIKPKMADTDTTTSSTMNMAETIPTETVAADHHLPNEMIVHILSRLEQPDMVNAYEVCMRWSKLIDRAIGFKLYIGDTVPDPLEFNPMSWTHRGKFEDISDYGTQECYLAVMKLVDPLPTFKYPRLLKRLWLDTPALTPITFAELTTSLKNLRKLTLHASTMSTLRMKGLKLPFDLLRSLTLSVYTIHDVAMNDEDRMLDNALRILRKVTLKSLALLAVHVPFHPTVSRDIADSALGFMIRHKRTLRKAIVSLEESNVNFRPGPAPIPNEAADAPPKDIDGFRLTSFTLHSARPGGGQMLGLRSIMERQLYLSSLHATTDYEPFVTLGPTISACSRTLTQVQMAIRPNDIGGSVFSLKAFEDCKNLKVLALLGPPKVDEANPDGFDGNEDELDGRLLTADIKEASCLPKKLEVVKIYNLFMRTVDTKSVVDLPAIRVLCFKNIGRHRDLGFDLKDAQELFNRKPPLKSISWSECINVNSVPTNVNTTDYRTFFTAMLIRQIEGSTFNMHLSPSGDQYLPGINTSEPQVLPGFSDEFVMDDQIFPMAEEEEIDEDEDDADEEDEGDGEVDEAEDDEEADVDQENALDQLMNAADPAVLAGAALAAAAVAEAAVPPNMFLNMDTEAEEGDADEELDEAGNMDIDIDEAEDFDEGLEVEMNDQEEAEPDDDTSEDEYFN